jgi:uncharacterized protein
MKIPKIIFFIFALVAGLYLISSNSVVNNAFVTSDNDSINFFFKNIPAPVGFVNDFEYVFNQKQIDGIDSLIKVVNIRKDVVLVVLSLDSSMANKNLFDAITLKTAKQWGIGDKNKNNGILIAFSKSLRMIRIQNGYGIEARLSDEETHTLINQAVIPEFKKGNYYMGIINIIKEIELKIN